MREAEITWNGKAVTAQMRAGAVRGLFLAAEHVLSESRMVVPIEEATLSRSGATSVDAEALKAAVSYDTPYAMRQHEDLTLRHDVGRTAKYLERPLESTRREQQKIIGDSIRGRMS